MFFSTYTVVYSADRTLGSICCHSRNSGGFEDCSYSAFCSELTIERAQANRANTRNSAPMMLDFAEQKRGGGLVYDR
jgi:hypothetical protein